MGLDGLACRLAEKAYRRGASIYMLAADDNMASRLDSQLWEGDESGFLPHDCWPDSADPATRLLLGSEAPPTEHHDVLINLAEDLPLCFSRFDRVLEIIDAAQPHAGRARYQFYRERGYPLQTHKIS